MSACEWSLERGAYRALLEEVIEAGPPLELEVRIAAALREYGDSDVDIVA